MPDDLTEFFLNVQGVGPSKAKILREAGYSDMESLKAASEAELASIKGIGPILAKKIKEALDVQVEDEIAGPELYLCPVCGAFIGKDATTCPQ